MQLKSQLQHMKEPNPATWGVNARQSMPRKVRQCKAATSFFDFWQRHLIRHAQLEIASLVLSGR